MVSQERLWFAQNLKYCIYVKFIASKALSIFLTDELKVLHFGVVYGHENEEKSWISQQKPLLIAKYYDKNIPAFAVLSNCFLLDNLENLGHYKSQEIT